MNISIKKLSPECFSNYITFLNGYSFVFFYFASIVKNLIREFYYVLERSDFKSKNYDQIPIY